MHQGRGGMGSHKHGVSGYPTRSPRYKFMQMWRDNKERREKKKPKQRFWASFAELFRHERPR